MRSLLGFALLFLSIAFTPAAFAVSTAATVSPAAPATAPSTASGDAAKAADKLDINSASEKELATLPGIGEVRAKAIVAARPFKRKDELVSKQVLSQGVYDKIKDRVIAKQAK